MSAGVTTCPRCGYDLSGQAASWEDACDVHGTCPECGLSFHWGDLKNERMTPPRWHVEYPGGRAIGKVLKTLGRSFRPGAFWRAISIERLRFPRRSVRFGIVGVVLSMVVGPAAMMAFVVTPAYFGIITTVSSWAIGRASSSTYEYWLVEGVSAAIPFGAVRLLVDP